MLLQLHIIIAHTQLLVHATLYKKIYLLDKHILSIFPWKLLRVIIIEIYFPIAVILVSCDVATGGYWKVEFDNFKTSFYQHQYIGSCRGAKNNHYISRRGSRSPG